MTGLLFLLAGCAAALDPNAMIQQAQQAAQQQAQQQGGPQTSSGTGSGFHELHAPVIRKIEKKPEKKAWVQAEGKVEGSGAAKGKTRAGGGRAGGVKLPDDSADWEPVSVRQGGGGKTSCRWRLKAVKVKDKATGKTKKILKGESSAAQATARWVKTGDDKKLVVALFPKGLAAGRVHLEVRLPVVEGILEKAQIAAVMAEPGGGALDDAAALRAKGVAFQEEFPASADLRLGALGKENAGSIKEAEFADRLPSGLPGLGLVSCDFSVKETQ